MTEALGSSGQVVRGGRSRKLWIPYSGVKLPPPRLMQLVAIATCALRREHDWSRWRVETEDWFEYVDAPLPWAWRICKRCGLSERVQP